MRNVWRALAAAVCCAVLAMLALALPSGLSSLPPFASHDVQGLADGIGPEEVALQGDESVPNFAAPGLAERDEALGQVLIDNASAPQPASAEDAAGAGPVPIDVPDLTDVPHVAGEVLVGIEEGVSVEEALAAIADETGIQAVSASQVADDCVELVLPEGVSVADALAVLPTAGVVSDAQPNYTYELMDEDAPLAALPASVLDGLSTQATVPNDPYAKNKTQWALDSMEVYDAWGIVKSNKKVTVAIIDSGFNVSHEDLKNVVVAPYNAVTGTGDVSGSAEHGTHVAGIAGAEANNAKGIAGVSYNARIMPIKVEDSNGGISTSTLLVAYDYVIKNKKAYNIRVVNMSIGAARDNTTVYAEDRRVYEKIEQAYNAGIVTVAAACNANVYGGKYYEPPFYAFPADYDKVVSVINLEDKGNGRVARYERSNYNRPGQRTKDVSAPGTGIMSTHFSGKDAYTEMGGTSMAAPQVAGVLALVFAANPSLTSEQAVSKLYSAATDIGARGWDVGTGYGEANAYKAVKADSAYLSGPSVLQVGSTSKYSVSQSGSWTWSTSSKSVASASATGAVKGVGAGEVTIEAKAADGKRACLTVPVYDATIAGPTSMKVGAQSAYKLKNAKNPVGVWKWTSSNPNVASVSSGTGVVNAKAVGTTKITVTLVGDSSVSRTITLKVSKTDIAGASITGVSNKPYTGGRITFPNLAVKMGSTTLEEGTDYAVSYKNNVKVGTATVVVTGKGKYTGTRSINFKINAVKCSVAYRTHVQSIGWQSWRSNGGVAGTTGQSKRLEAVNIKLSGLTGTTGGIAYRAHVQGIGWQGWRSNGSMAGTTGQSKRLEALQVKLTGAAAESFDVYYRAHVQHFGWMGWAKNGQMAGSAGYGYRLEALQVKVVPKNSNAPGSTYKAFLQKGK